MMNNFYMQSFFSNEVLKMQGKIKFRVVEILTRFKWFKQPKMIEMEKYKSC